MKLTQYTQGLTALCSSLALLHHYLHLQVMHFPRFQLIFACVLTGSPKGFSVLCNYTEAST